MKQDDLKKRMSDWVKRVGDSRAIIRLIEQGVAPTTALKLVQGNYQPEPRNLLSQAIDRAMEDEASSA